ncbi:GNAT family N-acetyltransferase [Sulfuracidifex tepidarius]|uniref:Mycothiol acetyltransferase n=1 Tax=Sulfuracidifex tepidarius TaxID=1294262 RepID=A0A510E384_9CREN|nr:GNAT family N-acetyltransferase [Sulfuracidifex tepidarius]BBG23774.1 Mycothiol acetyltransferase [Sulfuracidifex tepidarius]BBG26528.1 Mycothiol acetyltransferase [Sulfuracidifex tepidarius]
MSSELEKLFLTDPIRFAFEIYDLRFDKEYTEFKTVREGYLMIYIKFYPPRIILHANEEDTARELLSILREEESKFILFTEPKWVKLLNFPNAKIYPEILMTCNKPNVFRNENVRRLSIEDKEEILTLYEQGLGSVLLQLLSENKTTAYGLFLDNHLVSAAYTLIESENFAIIGGVFTKKEFRNMGLATSVVSTLTEDLTKRGKVASLYVREDNSPAIHVYKKIGFKEYWKRLWVSVNVDEKPL